MLGSSDRRRSIVACRATPSSWEGSRAWRRAEAEVKWKVSREEPGARTEKKAPVVRVRHGCCGIPPGSFLRLHGNPPKAPPPPQDPLQAWYTTLWSLVHRVGACVRPKDISSRTLASCCRKASIYSSASFEHCRCCPRSADHDLLTEFSTVCPARLPLLPPGKEPPRSGLLPSESTLPSGGVAIWPAISRSFQSSSCQPDVQSVRGSFIILAATVKIL